MQTKCLPFIVINIKVKVRNMYVKYWNNRLLRCMNFYLCKGICTCFSLNVLSHMIGY